MSDFILTTVLRFADRAEGQVLHRGTRDECETLSNMMPAISVSGEAPIAASHLIVEADQFAPVDVGQAWRCAYPKDAA